MAGLDGCRKPRPHRDSFPGPSTAYRVAIPTTLSQPTEKDKKDVNTTSNTQCATVQRHLSAHRDHSMIANSRTKILATFRGIFGIIRGI